MNVKDLIIEKLTTEGFDGLISASGSCACFLETGDCPCSEMNSECLPGHTEIVEISVATIKAVDVPALTIEQPWVLVEDD